jgi:hypothetical protein
MTYCGALAKFYAKFCSTSHLALEYIHTTKINKIKMYKKFFVYDGFGIRYECARKMEYFAYTRVTFSSENLKPSVMKATLVDPMKMIKPLK